MEGGFIAGRGMVMNGIDFLVAAFAVGIVAFAVFRKVKRSKKGCACDGCDICPTKTGKAK
jgi:hypothetical protein